jgi:hypothetical protein
LFNKLILSSVNNVHKVGGASSKVLGALRHQGLKLEKGPAVAMCKPCAAGVRPYLCVNREPLPFLKAGFPDRTSDSAPVFGCK